MNVELPFMHRGMAWLWLLGACILVAAIGTYFISDHKNKSLSRLTSKSFDKRTPSERKYLSRKKQALKEEKKEDR